MQLHRGSAAVRLRSADAARGFELLAGDGRLSAARPGDFRIDHADTVDRLTVWSGETLYEAPGLAVPVLPGARADVWRDAAGQPTQPVRAQPAADEFRAWVAALDRADDAAVRSAAARYVSPEMTGAEDLYLDRYGRWETHAEYGPVWLPGGVADGWAPYRQGRWSWVAPWGWTWIDDAPWGFAPFHYGRWLSVGGRWAWSPGSYVAQPVYAPALVAWVGGSGLSAAVGAGAPPAVGWFPLGPREVYVPAYRASPRYWHEVNRPQVRDPARLERFLEDPDRALREAPYRHRGEPAAWTVVPAGIVGGRRPVAPAVLPVAVGPMPGGPPGERRHPGGGARLLPVPAAGWVAPPPPPVAAGGIRGPLPGGTPRAGGPDMGPTRSGRGGAYGPAAGETAAGGWVPALPAAQGSGIRGALFPGSATAARGGADARPVAQGPASAPRQPGVVVPAPAGTPPPPVVESGVRGPLPGGTPRRGGPDMGPSVDAPAPPVVAPSARAFLPGREAPGARPSSLPAAPRPADPGAPDARWHDDAQRSRAGGGEPGRMADPRWQEQRRHEQLLENQRLLEQQRAQGRQQLLEQQRAHEQLQRGQDLQRVQEQQRMIELQRQQQQRAQEQQRSLEQQLQQRRQQEQEQMQQQRPSRSRHSSSSASRSRCASSRSSSAACRSRARRAAKSAATSTCGASRATRAIAEAVARRRAQRLPPRLSARGAARRQCLQARPRSSGAGPGRGRPQPAT